VTRLRAAAALGLLAVLALLAGPGCRGEAATGPARLAWDRDACAHCYMTIGDRRTAAQLRLTAGGPAFLFDDLGCALLFVAREQGSHLPAELWVRDPEGLHWIDGLAARYASGATTPMGYGFTSSEAPGAVSLAEAWSAIREMEDERRSAGH